jgi:hypothetical protein
VSLLTHSLPKIKDACRKQSCHAVLSLNDNRGFLSWKGKFLQWKLTELDAYSSDRSDIPARGACRIIAPSDQKQFPSYGSRIFLESMVDFLAGA